MSQHTFRPSLYQRLCGVLILLLKPLSLPVEMLLNTGVGERHAGVLGLVSLGLMIGCGALSMPLDGAGLFVLASVFLLRMIGHRSACENDHKYGDGLVHSRYPGKPLWGLWRDRFKEDSLRVNAAFLVMLVGVVVSPLSPPLGAYLAWSGLATLAVLGLRAARARDRLLDLRDAEIDRLADQGEVRDCHERLGLTATVSVRTAEAHLFESLPASPERPALEMVPQALS
jgi:hypothetical protein